MADRGFKITKSASADVVAYRVTLLQGGAAIGTKDYPDASVVDPSDPNKRVFDLAGDPAFPNLDGKYDVEVRTIDDAGNISPPLLGALTLDFVAPEAPTNFEAF